MDAEEAAEKAARREQRGAATRPERRDSQMEPVFRTLEIAGSDRRCVSPAPGSPITGWRTFQTAGGAVIAINHTSYLDFLPAALAATQAAPAAALHDQGGDDGSEDRQLPDQSTPRRSRWTAGRVRAPTRSRWTGCAQGELVGVYPEATISRSFELKEFKTGAARMAIDAQVPIIPLIVWGAQRHVDQGSPAQTWAARRSRSPSRSASRCRPPSTVGQTDAAMRAAMNALLHEVQESYEHPEGAYWVPRRLGGSAPDPARGEGARRGRTGRARPQGTAGQ